MSMSRMRTTTRPRVALAIALGLIATVAGGNVTARAADPPLLYLPAGSAVTVDAGLGGGTLRQAPAALDPRWTRGRTVGKVRAAEIEGRGVARIAAILRAGWRRDGADGLVAIDEITPSRWTPAGSAALARALDRLGSDANRVMFYAAPSLVEQVGRVDPRRALPVRLAAIVDAVSRGRATYLATYRGDGTPFPAREMATHPTRWAMRWPAGRGELRVMLGSDAGAGQAALWTRLRATAAGRALLARGPAAYGLPTPSAARGWLAQYRAFRAAPTVSATGADYAVPRPGGLTLAAAGNRRVRITIARSGRAVVTMTPRAGGKVRAIRKLNGPTRAVLVRLPADSRPGVYRIRAVLIGDGLRDRASLGVRVRS